jgi:hypothetical protein
MSYVKHINPATGISNEHKNSKHLCNNLIVTSFAMEMSYTSLIYIANGAVDNNIIIGWVDSTAKAMPPMA